MRRQLLVFLVTSASMTTCHAIANVSVDIHDAVTLTNAAHAGSGPIEYTDSVSLSGGVASGYANLSGGVLRLLASAPQGALSTSFVDARFSDTVTFNGASGGIAYIDWLFEGSLSSFNGRQSSAALTLYDNGNTYTVSLNNQACAPVTPTTSCTVGTAIQQYGSFAIPIGAGARNITISLGANVQNGQTANFSNTARVFLRTPTGVTYASTSGAFLTTASPVPEPSGTVLLIAGVLSTVILYKRKMKAASASPTAGAA